jgi:uncharacterized GH25 family protein
MIDQSLVDCSILVIVSAYRKNCKRGTGVDNMKWDRFVLAFVIGFAACSSSAIFAHDLWLIPGEKDVPGKPVLLHANVGMDFPKSVHAIDPAQFKRTLLVGPDGKELQAQSDGVKESSGLLKFQPKQAGIYQLAVQTEPKLIELSAEAFNEYLVADGLSHIFRLRAKEKSLDQPGRERYQKSPKALIQVGDGGGGDWSKALGLPLEIVPLGNPFLLKKGDTLKVRVLFHGKPLPEANLGWQLPGDGETARGTVRTDDQGEALIAIARADLMTVRLTHMIRPKHKDYEWESYWTTLTFRIPVEIRKRDSLR